MAERLPDGSRVEVLGTVPEMYQGYVGRHGSIRWFATGGWYSVALEDEPEHKERVLYLTRREIKPVDEGA